MVVHGEEPMSSPEAPAARSKDASGGIKVPEGEVHIETDNGGVDSEEGESEDDEDEGDPDQTIMNMGRHDRMQRIQKVLYDQLVGNDERLTMELREREEEVRRMKQRREDVGVQLYGVQQQLAQLQVALEGSHRKLTTYHNDRFAAEDLLDEHKEQVAERKALVGKHRATLYKTQTELDTLNATLRQVEKYSEEMKYEIARTQREAQKAEEMMTNMEKSKVKQDLYIDSLNEQLKRLEDQIGVSTAHLKSQQLETAAAEETLREASAQMEVVAFEKKQLLQQWKSALVGLQQRDQALQATQQSISKVNEEDLALSVEVKGYKASIEKAQREHETLLGTVERFNAEIRFVEEQIGSLKKEQERLASRYEMLTKSLRQTEAEESKVKEEGKKLDGENQQVQQQLETTQRDRHVLEDQVASLKNEQTTANKAVHNLTKETLKLQGVVHEKENALAELRNEIARVNVDILNVQSHIGQLEEVQGRTVGDLQNEDRRVEKVQLELRQRNDEIEKKMLRLDRLNKKYEQLMSKVEDENTGPLEATIKNQTRETAEVRRRNAELQKEWLQIQTVLVNLSIESQEMGEKNGELKSKTSVLEQKQLRLMNDLAKMTQDVKQLRTVIQAMHTDTIKLNELIAKNTTRQEELVNMNHGMELEFKQQLKELEAEAMNAERRATELKNEKQELLDQIVEVERQIMLWEKKILLEKETQAALDPEVGQAEARSMEKEIHRMRLRLEALQRSQEQMLIDMEQAVHKRDLLALRGRSKKDADVTYAAVTAKASTLQNNLQKMERDTMKLDKTIKKKMISCEDLTFQLEKASAELHVDEERVATLQKSINDSLYAKQRLIDAESRKLRLLQRLEAVRKAAATKGVDEDKAKNNYDRARSSVLVIQSIIDKLKSQYPHLSEVLSRVAMLAEDPPVEAS